MVHFHIASASSASKYMRAQVQTQEDTLKHEGRLPDPGSI